MCVCVTEVWIVFFFAVVVVVVVVVVWLPCRTAVEGCQRQRPDRGGVGDWYKELFWWNYGGK